MTNNKYINKWIDEMVALTTPDNIVWIDGSEAQTEALKKQAVEEGTLFELNPELLPNCYLHRTAVNDVARVENRTFICTTDKADAGNINNWMAPSECYEKSESFSRGSMKGQTMYVIPYSMGVVGSDFAKIGIELTDSIYVVLNMLIMTRAGQKVIDALDSVGDRIYQGTPCTCQTSMKITAISATSRRITLFGRLTQVTAETFFSERSASRSVSLPISDAKRAGWLSICSFSVSKLPTAA